MCDFVQKKRKDPQGYVLGYGDLEPLVISFYIIQGMDILQVWIYVPIVKKHLMGTLRAHM